MDFFLFKVENNNKNKFTIIKNCRQLFMLAKIITVGAGAAWRVDSIACTDQTKPWSTDAGCACNVAICYWLMQKNILIFCFANVDKQKVGRFILINIT